MAAQNAPELKGRILSAKQAEELAWMGEQEEVDAFVSQRTYNTDAVERLRERQRQQRNAEQRRITGTTLDRKSAQWLFHDAEILDVSSL